MAECKHLIDPASACLDCHPPAVPLPGSSLWGPFFQASYEGECDHCGDDIYPGDAIRADGEGGWLCETCGDDGQVAESAPPPVPVTVDTLAPAELRRRFEEGYT